MANIPVVYALTAVTQGIPSLGNEIMEQGTTMERLLQMAQSSSLDAKVGGFCEDRKEQDHGSFLSGFTAPSVAAVFIHFWTDPRCLACFLYCVDGIVGGCLVFFFLFFIFTPRMFL